MVAPGPNKDDPWAHISAWPVPVDDTRTMRFVLNAVEVSDPAKLEELKSQYDLNYNPADHYDALFHDGVVEGVQIRPQALLTPGGDWQADGVPAAAHVDRGVVEAAVEPCAFGVRQRAADRQPFERLRRRRRAWRLASGTQQNRACSDLVKPHKRAPR